MVYLTHSPSQAAAGHECLEELSHSHTSCSPSRKAPQGFQQPALPVGQKFPAWATEKHYVLFYFKCTVHPQAAPPFVLIPLNRFLLALYFYALERGLGDSWGFLDAQTIKSPPASRRHGFKSWVRKNSWRRERLPTPVFLPGESHEQRSLAGYSPWGPKETQRSNTTLGEK